MENDSDFIMAPIGDTAIKVNPQAVNQCEQQSKEEQIKALKAELEYQEFKNRVLQDMLEMKREQDAMQARHEEFGALVRADIDAGFARMERQRNGGSSLFNFF